MTFIRLGNVYVAASEFDAAWNAWQQALAIMTELSHPDADRVRALLNDLQGRWHVHNPVRVTSSHAMSGTAYRLVR
jgi:hypothetical protein